MLFLIVVLLLMIIAVSTVRNSERHKAAVARRATRNRQLYLNHQYQLSRAHEIRETRESDGFWASVQKARDIRHGV